MLPETFIVCPPPSSPLLRRPPFIVSVVHARLPPCLFPSTIVGLPHHLFLAMQASLSSFTEIKLRSELMKEDDGEFLLNSQQIFERIFRDKYIMDIIGALEFDPKVPHVQNHRTFLKEHVVFKEVVSLLKDHNTFVHELFSRLNSSTTSPESKKN